MRFGLRSDSRSLRMCTHLRNVVTDRYQGGTLMVWAGVSNQSRSIEGFVTANEYRYHILESIVLSRAAQIGEDFVLM